MASEKQRAAARKNIKKAAAVAKKKRTIAHLPKKTRTALGKQAEQGQAAESREVLVHELGHHLLDEFIEASLSLGRPLGDQVTETGIP